MSKAQAITYFRHGDSIRLNDESVLEEVRRSGRRVSNEDLMDIIWGSEAVTPKEARRRFQPIYRATHNLVELGAIVAHTSTNDETGGEETVYAFVPEGVRVPVPSKYGYKAKFDLSQARVRELEARIALIEKFEPCDSCTALLCRVCYARREAFKAVG